MWQNAKAQIVTKHQTHILIKTPNSKTYITKKFIFFIKHKKSNCDKTLKKSYAYNLNSEEEEQILQSLLFRTTWHLNSQWDVL